MPFLRLVKDFFQRWDEKHIYRGLFAISIFIWIVVFRDFVFNKLAFTSDAISYYDHTKFFIESLMRGEFPLWDPNWNSGIPNGLFLRRLGCFNPAYVIIVLLKLTGLSFRLSYLFFIVIYFFIGMFGFYALARKIYGERVFAFLAFILLSFSALGSRLFDSYLHLEFVPLVWFFYFLISFFKSPQKYSLLGITLTMMILFSTYIPFYFITLMILFCLCGGILFFNQIQPIFKGCLIFFKSQKILTGICLAALLLSLVPGIQFFLEMKQGDIVFPGRNRVHQDSILQTDNSLEVDVETVTEWGLEEDLAFSVAYSNLRQYKFALMYVSGIVFIILGLGMFARINRILAMILVWATSIFLVATPYGGIYPFLQKHIFYFKYFRNLHFFLWWILLPLFILFIVGLFKSLWDISAETKHKNQWMVLVGLVHAIMFGFVLQQKFALLSTYWMIIISCVMFSYIFYSRDQRNKIVVSFLLMLAVIPQFSRVFGSLSQNYEVKATAYEYDVPYNEFSFERDKFLELSVLPVDERKVGGALHVAIKEFSELNENIDNRIFRHYLHHRFIAYDSVVKWDGNIFNPEQIEKVFLGKIPMALVEDFTMEDLQNIHSNIKDAMPIKNDQFLEVLEFHTNEIKFKTKFKEPKFIVYNDGFYGGWFAKIDGVKKQIRRANINFKGMWVPAGEHVIQLKYGFWFDYMLVGILLLSFYGICIGCLWEWRKLKQYD